MEQCKENFDVVKCIGGGAFGSVYECLNKVDHCRYAVKRIKTTQSELEPTLREVEALANLDHHHIVRYYNAWLENPTPDKLEEYENYWQSFHENSQSSDLHVSQEDSQESQDSDQPKSFKFLYIHMELCSGDTLRGRIDCRNSKTKGVILGHQQAKTYMLQLASGMHYIHEQGWIHRDIKPENIFFAKGSQDHLKIGDFGLANLSSHAHEPYSLTPDVGTVVYRSPEVKNNSEYTNKVDIYSMGVIYIELMFVIPSQQELVNILNTGRENMKPDQNWDPEYASLFNAMLSTSPEKRPNADRISKLINDMEQGRRSSRVRITIGSPYHEVVGSKLDKLF